MGQKVNPIAFRLGYIHQWSSKWFSKSRKEYAAFLRQDIELKKFIKKALRDASVAKIEIERSGNTVTIHIHTAKPGMVIGRSGEGVEKLKKQIQELVRGSKTTVTINIQEVKTPNLSAELIVQSMVADLEKRIPFRRIMKQAISRCQKTSALGIKVMCSGRLNGAEIARRETLTWGNLPLHTIRADIDYSRGVAHTTYGTIGVKVWIYKGEKFEKEKT